MLVGRALAQAKANQFFSLGSASCGANKEVVQLEVHANQSNSIHLVGLPAYNP